MGSNMIIPATKSLTVTNRFPNKNFQEDAIIIGNIDKYKYYSYLYFDISLIPKNVSISKAELVLFKIEDSPDNSKKIFLINPLHDSFNSNTNYKNKPDIEKHNKIGFYTVNFKKKVTVDITSIMLLWARGKLDNKGIMLYGKKNDNFIKFSSSNCKDKEFVPFIKVSYEGEGHSRQSRHCREDSKEVLVQVSKVICEEILKNECDCEKKPTLTKIRVTGTIQPYSIYDIVIALEVTRAHTGHKDKYYITEEYNNLKNPKPYYVDKTYTIPVVPRKRSGDKEKAKIYGAYRE